MRKTFLVAVAIISVSPALWANGAEVDPTLVAAAEKMLSTMPADFYQVDLVAAQQQIENAKPFILDVREPAEIAGGVIAGAVSIPIRELPKAIAKLPENMTAPILTYCKAGYRGGMATIILRMWGYTNVRTIKGGLDAWTKAGLPMRPGER